MPFLVEFPNSASPVSQPARRGGRIWLSGAALLVSLLDLEWWRLVYVVLIVLFLTSFGH